MADKELQRVRTEFVNRVKKPVIEQLLDDLLEDGVLNDGEVNFILEDKSTTEGKARGLIDLVKSKGDKASRKLIAHLEKRDKELHSALGLSCSQPAPAAAGLVQEQGWSTTMISSTEDFWREKQKEDIYPVTRESMRSPVALLITNIEFTDKKLNRNGADKDEENMEEQLTRLGYEVVKHRNLTAQDIDDALISFSKHPKLRGTDSVVVVIMSHRKRGVILGVDWKEEKPDEFPIDNIYKHLGPTECPALQDKPKIIIIQACRGGEKGSVLVSDAADSELVQDNVRSPSAGEDDIEEDTLKFVPREKDFISLLSCTPDTVSYRSPEKGSFLILNLNEVLNTFAHKEEIEVLFRKAKSSFTPEVVRERLGISYRFRFPSSGLFECSLTRLVFSVTHEGEVTYKTLIWDSKILDPASKVPRGPLFSIKCPQSSICQLHLPHCEPEPGLVSECLAVVHLTDDSMNIIQPLEITESHVVVETPNLSSFGIILDVFKRVKGLKRTSVRGQVLLFSRPAPRKHLILSVILLPSNVPLLEVQEQYENCKYIPAPSNCQLYKKQLYSLHSDPEGFTIQPPHAPFIENYGPNYHATFEVNLPMNTKEVTLLVQDPKMIPVWKHGLYLPDPSNETHLEIYPVTRESMRSRVALLITNIEFTDKEYNRNGADKDERNMEKQLTRLGYEVVKHRNLTAQDIDDALISFSKHPKLKKTDSVVVVIMSHGERGVIHGVDRKEEKPDEFPIDNIYKLLGPKDCPALQDKPKIIIIQACRGEEEGSVEVSDAADSELVQDDVRSPSAAEEDTLKFVHREKDFISLLSSTPDTVSYRRPEEGSILILNLNKVLNTFAHKEEIVVLFRRVMELFEDFSIGSKMQMPTIDRCTLTRAFFFFPGL